MNIYQKMLAELIGTFWLVLVGYGSAVVAIALPSGIGLLGGALAFGLSVLTMVFAIGHVSGCHLNPAVSIVMWASGRFRASELAPYMVAQVVGGITAAGILFLIATGNAEFNIADGFTTNGFGEHSAGGYTIMSAYVTEFFMSFFFLLIILGATDDRAPSGFAPLAIGFGLTLIHLVSFSVTNTSANPARSTGPALFGGDWAVSQLWLFWCAPIAGALVAGAIYQFFSTEE